MKLKNSINETKHVLESTGNRADHVKERISKLKHKNVEMSQVEGEKELTFFKKPLRKLFNSIRKGNVMLMGILEGGETRE